MIANYDEEHRMVKRQAEGVRQDPWPDVLVAVAALRTGHRVGRGVLEKVGERAERGKINELAKSFGYTVDATRKLRQFAKLYSAHDLAMLCRLCEKHRRAFGLTFIYRLVSIKGKANRTAFQKEAVVGHWGHVKFVRELRRRFPHGHRRGRQQQLPTTIPEALAEIEDAKGRFVRLLEYCVTLAGEVGGPRREKKLLHEVADQLTNAIKGVGTSAKRKSMTKGRRSTSRA
jgi:hypothetical protein